MQSSSLRRLISLFSAGALVASLAVATLPAAALAVTPPSGTVIFDNTAAVLPGNLPSYGPEAYGFNEWGGGVTFSGTARNLSTATVTLSSWACESGDWLGGCVTTPGATFNVPITFNVYNANGDGTVGPLLTTKTQTFPIPYRPSADAINCPVMPIKWSDGTTCFNGKATNITFNFPAGTLLPNTAIFGVTFNTNTAGYAPLGVSGPTDALNIATFPGTGTATEASVGTLLPNDTSSYLSPRGSSTLVGLPAVTQMPTGPDDNFAGYEPAVQITALPVCTSTGLERDSINLTAALVNPTGTVSGAVDATGCNIGVYYGPGKTGSVDAANIYGANYYGVVANAAAVNVTNTTIHDIGESPLNGSQHGVGVLYTTVNQAGASTGTSATGTLSDTTITKYQKNGVVVSGAGAKVSLVGNTVKGEGGVTYIAQNGIQISFGASARLVDNNVSLNNYLPSKVTACGLLIYKAGGVSGATKTGISYIKADNNFHDNETDICNFGKGGGFSL